MGKALLWVAAGTGFTFLMTSLGASLVFFFRKKISVSVQRIFLGFAAGVMIAASVWSLLIPAIEEAESRGTPGWLPAAGGFVLGIAFDAARCTAAASSSRSIESGRTVIVLETHDIADARGYASQYPGRNGGRSFFCTGGTAYGKQCGHCSCYGAGAWYGNSNFPEGAAISLPLRQEGVSAGKSFLYGSLSGIVEPIFGILVVLIAGSVSPLMPWLLSFAAGAMMYVVVEELIPEAHLGEHSNIGTLGVMGGFLVMMILDVALG